MFSKYFKSLSIIILCAGSIGQADSFDIIKDGKNYRCEEIDFGNPGDAIACADKAYSGPFSKAESLELCQGATSISPAECAIAAYAGPFNKNQAIKLCKNARSIGPYECAKKAYAGPFNIDESLTLCEKSGTIANADCAIRAYAGPYSKEEALNMCRANPVLLNRMLAAFHKEEQLGFSNTLQKSLMKAEMNKELPIK